MEISSFPPPLLTYHELESLKNIPPISTSTTFYPKDKSLLIVEAVGNQNFEDHIVSFIPQLVPLNTTLMSSLPLETAK